MIRLPVRIALVEDDRLLRTLLVERFEREPDLVLTCDHGTVAGAQAGILPGTVDVALLDIGLPDGDGISLAITLQRADPALRVLLLSAQDLLSAAASAQTTAPTPWSYLSKRSALAADQLADTVRSVADGKVVIDPTLQRGRTRRAEPDLTALTPGQLGVLRLTAEGLTNQAIADLLDISPKAVEAHLTAVYRTLHLDGARNARVAAVLTYLRHTAPEHPRTPGARPGPPLP